MEGSHLELTERLAAIAGFIPPGTVIADIGTDHARLPVYVVERGICPAAVATDLNEKPYRSALQAVQNRGLAGKISVRRGDGMRPLQPGEAEVVVVAGMGGNTIRQILAGAPEVLARVRRLILQPMVDGGDLRRWLAENGWRLVDETLVEEGGHLYVIDVAEPGREMVTDPVLLEIGPRLLEKGHPLLFAYLDKLAAGYHRVLYSLTRGRSSEALHKAVELTARLKRIKDYLENNRQLPD